MAASAPSRLHTFSHSGFCFLKFDHGKEDGVGDLFLVRQALFADLSLKVVDTVSKFAI